jgi:hypothetical protein
MANLNFRTLICYAFAVGVLTQSARSAHAVGEQVGRLRGVVTDTQGKPLDAVTVTASGPALIGGPRTVFSNESGRYEIANLPPGAYSIEFSYPGTEPLTRQVVVQTGEAQTLNVSWSIVVSEAELISLRETRQTTRPDSAQTGSVRDFGSVNRMPTSRSYQGITQQVPGVSGGANPNIKGGGSRNNRYLIDGMDVTDPVTNTFTKNITFESMGAVDVLTGGMDAEYNAIGGVINVVTKGGADNFHATASVYANHSDLSASGNFGTQLYEYKQPFNDIESGLTRSGQLAINVGGPILARKLWYSATYELFLNESAQVKGPPLGVPPYNIQHPSLTSTNHLARLRLNYVPTGNHRVWLNLMTDPGQFNNTNGGNARLGVAENRQDQGGGFALLGWEWLGSQTFFPSLQVGLLYNFLEIGPQGWLGDVDFTGCMQFSPQNCVYERNRTQRFNSNDLTTWYQGDAYQLDKRYKMQIDPSLTIRGTLMGSHTLKMGVQAQFVYRTRVAEVPGRFSFEDLNEDGALLEEGLCDPATGVGCFRRIETEPLDAKEQGYAVGLFVQDRWWTPLQWLTVNPGLRADLGYTEDRLGRRIYRLFALAPRLGATADITRDGRNVLFAYYGRHTEPMSLATASSVDAIEASRDITTEWDPAMMDYTVPVSISGGPGGIIIDTKAKMPRSDEITAGARREIFPNAVASVEYTWKRIAYTWDTIEINRIWDPTGARVIGWRDPAKQGRDVQEYTTPESPRIYQGLSFATEGRPTPNWDYLASYTVSWNYGYSTRTDNPRQLKFSDGYLAQDLRHYIRAGGSYFAFNQLVLGAYMQYQSGTALTKGFYNAQDNDFSMRRSPGGTTTTTPNDIAGISEFRIPDFFRLDLRLSYNVLPNRFRNKLNLIVDVFNVMNLRVPTGVTAADVARFGQVTGRQSPFRAQLAINWTY